MKTLQIKRTSAGDRDFQLLIAQLDNELWNELKEDQATYDQYNKVPDIQTALVLYLDSAPVASGCFKQHGDDTVEIKRMYVAKQARGQGLSKLVLDELEKWAIELGFAFAVLETSVHFKVARTLYTQAGYEIIDNYDQYIGLADSVCMRKKLSRQASSEFSSIPGIEYFDFEEDFVEKNVRCVPMIVRFKMDRTGIKLKLTEWSKFSVEERIELAQMPCANEEESGNYNHYLSGLIKKYTGNDPTALNIDENPAWADQAMVPSLLNAKLKPFGWNISAEQWKNLTELQRFALMKLCREGHENSNLPKALKEFKLINQH